MRILYVTYDLTRISVVNVDKKFVFKAATLEETTNWVKKLNEALCSSEGYMKKLSYLAHYPRFWRVESFLHRKITKVSMSFERLLKLEI